MINLGAKVKLLRALFGMSQSELARKLGISQAKLSQIEAGTNPLPVDAETLENIRRAFGGVNLDDPRIETFMTIIPDNKVMLTTIAA